jgi:hypothetical protein
VSFFYPKIPSKSLKYPILLSLAVHSLLIALLLFSASKVDSGAEKSKGGVKDGTKEGVSGATEGTIMPKLEETPVTLVEVPKDGIIKSKSKTKYAEHDCKGHKSYGGIGVTTAPVYVKDGDYLQQIVEIFDNYPAAKGGLQIGDIVVEPRTEIMGTPGTDVTINILRDGNRMTITVTREKICLEEML